MFRCGAVGLWALKRCSLNWLLMFGILLCDQVFVVVVVVEIRRVANFGTGRLTAKDAGEYSNVRKCVEGFYNGARLQELRYKLT